MQWKPAFGFPRYEISDTGLLRRVSNKLLIDGWVGNHGYREYQLVGPDGRKHRALGHRLVLSTFVGPAPPQHEGAHFDGDKLNNDLSNLRWATSKENKADMVRHGRRYLIPPRRGADNNKTKLTAVQVAEIRDKYRNGEGSYRALAHSYGVDKSLIGYIVRQVIWKEAA